MSRYIFGPIASRRFGLSLGIDLSPDQKSCNFDCLYCELGGAKTVSFIKNPPLVKDVVTEVKEFLETKSDIDVITITSNGEPTLYGDLDKLVDEINKIKQDKKLLILTNSSTIFEKNIQTILGKFDIVKLSLDCATQKCFKKIDRPLKSISLEDIVKGIKEFRKDFKNALVIEVLVVKGINDNEEEMKKLNDILNDIKPDRIDFGTIDRPPAYKIEPVMVKRLNELGECFTNIPLSIAAKREGGSKTRDYTKEQILSTIKRRPFCEEDVQNLFSKRSKDILASLEKEGKVIKKDIAGVKFYSNPLS